MALKYHLRAFRIDAFNRLKYGALAPRYAERIWIHPAHCKRYIEAADFAAHFGARVRQKMSGRVIDEWPNSLEQPFENHPKLNYCRAHWCEGKSWAESGAIDFMLGKIAGSPIGMIDKCRNREDVEQRFNDLDGILADAKTRGGMRSYQELHPGNFREVDGILMHLGPDGEPVFSGAGCHRFAIARILDAPFPAQLGAVHVSALGVLPGMRKAE